MSAEPAKTWQWPGWSEPSTRPSTRLGRSRPSVAPNWLSGWRAVAPDDPEHDECPRPWLVGGGGKLRASTPANHGPPVPQGVSGGTRRASLGVVTSSEECTRSQIDELEASPKVLPHEPGASGDQNKAVKRQAG